MSSIKSHVYQFVIACVSLEFCVLLAIGFFLPVRFEAVLEKPVYENAGIDESNISVMLYSLFGYKYVIVDGYTVSLSGDCKEVTVSYHRFSQVIQTTPVRFLGVFAEYTEPLYQGMPVDTDAILVEGQYEDGTNFPVNYTGDIPGSVNSDTSVMLFTKYGDTVLELSPIEVKELTATYSQPTYPGDTFQTSYVEVSVVFEDGHTEPVPNFNPEISSSLITGAMDIPIFCSYGCTVLHLEPAEILGIEADYLGGTVYEGGSLQSRYIHVYLLFSEGRRRDLQGYQIDMASLVDVSEDTDIRVHTDFGDTSLRFTFVGVSDVVPVVKQAYLYEGDVPDILSVKLVYEDGTELALSASEVDDLDFDKAIVSGENTYSFSYQGRFYSFVLKGRRESNVSRAIEAFSDDLANAVESYVGENLFVTIRHYTLSSASYYLTHVIMNSPSQIHAGLSYDDYAGERETPTHAAARLGWVVGVNGGNFSYSTGGADTSMATAIIKNGAIMSDSGMTANGREICLSIDGSLSSAISGTSVSALLADGVTDTFSCGDTELIMNGERVNVGLQSYQYRYPRTAVGMVRPGEYYLITAGSGSYSGGMTYDEIRDILWDLGCTFGKCMDGGGSSALVFQGSLVNIPAGGTERAVADFLYFMDVSDEELMDVYPDVYYEE